MKARLKTRSPYYGGVSYDLVLYTDEGYFSTQKKGIGVYIEKDNRFMKKVDKEKHFFVKYGGYAIAEILLMDLEARGCKTIVIQEFKEDEWNRTLISKLNQWEEKGIGVKQSGYEKQICLPVHNMIINNNKG